MRESELYEQLAQYMNLKHRGVPFHFDLSGVHNPSHKTRNLYGRLNARAWPDLHIAKPTFYTLAFGGQGDMQYAGLFLELKRDGTRLKKRDGTWASDHIAEQAAVLKQLQDQGYIAQFAVGFDEATALIDSYLGGDTTNAREEASQYETQLQG